MKKINYQLMKTSTLLGGQHKFDIYLKPGDDGSVMNNKLSFSTLSPQIYFDWVDDNDILNRPHELNLKKMYDSLGDTFFENPEESMIPWIKDKMFIDEITTTDINKFEKPKEYLNIINDYDDIQDNTYRCGLRRTTGGNKSMSFLCPLWIENSDDLQKLSFRLVIKNLPDDSQYLIQDYRDSIHTLVTIPINPTNELKAYLVNYFKPSDEKIINIDFEREEVWVEGRSLLTGEVMTADESDTLIDLIYRERPLMEVDYMIGSLLKNNKFITKQLINIDFHFDLHELISPLVYNSLRGYKVVCYIEAGTYDTQLGFQPFEFKDLYTNYTKIFGGYIDSTVGFEWEKSRNILDYLGDHKDISLIYNNKVIQNTFHWSISNNNDYIFNLYNGYAPAIASTGPNADKTLEGHFFGQPLLSHRKYKLEYNNNQWCRIFNLTQANPTGIVSSIRDMKDEDFTPFSFEGTTFWSNNAKFDVSNLTSQDIKVNMVMVNDAVFVQPPQWDSIWHGFTGLGLGYNCYIDTSDTGGSYPNNPLTKIMVVYITDSITGTTYVTIICTNANRDWATSLNFQNFEAWRLLQEVSIQDPIIDYVKSILAGYVAPVKVIINHSIVSKKQQEITATKKSVVPEETHFKSLNKGFVTYLYRYGGHIKPTFIDIPKFEDYMYQKEETIDTINNKFNIGWCHSVASKDPQNNENLLRKIKRSNMGPDTRATFSKEITNYQDYKTLASKNVEPVYPSLNYFPFVEIERETERNIIGADITDPVNSAHYEERWGKYSTINILPSTFDVLKEDTEINNTMQSWIDPSFVYPDVRSAIGAYNDTNKTFVTYDSLLTYYKEYHIPYQQGGSMYVGKYDVECRFEYKSESDIGINYYLTYKLK